MPGRHFRKDARAFNVRTRSRTNLALYLLQRDGYGNGNEAIHVLPSQSNQACAGACSSVRGEHHPHGLPVCARPLGGEVDPEAGAMTTPPAGEGDALAKVTPSAAIIKVGVEVADGSPRSPRIGRFIKRHLIYSAFSGCDIPVETRVIDHPTGRKWPGLMIYKDGLHYAPQMCEGSGRP